MKKNQPKWKTDQNSLFHPNTHTAFLIVCPIVILIAAVVFALSFSYTYDYLTAPYRVDVDATLTEITEGNTEKWEYIESREEARNPNERATRTYTEKIYTYHWEYTIDGKTHTYKNTSSLGAENKIGDVKRMHFWSNDGEEYFRYYQSGLNYALMAVSAVVMIAALFVIVRIIIIKIKMSSEKKKKAQRRAVHQSHPNASLVNLGNFDGKRVRITDENGDIFEGVASYENKDYCEHEYGRREPCLQIVNFTFFRSDIKQIEALKGQYSAPFGTIEELNYQDGIDSIEDELFCEENESVYRMLLCLEAHIVRNGEQCPGLNKLLQRLLQTELAEQTRKKAAELTEYL